MKGMMSRALLAGVLAAVLTGPLAYGFSVVEGVAVVVEMILAGKELLKSSDPEPAVEVEQCGFNLQGPYHVGETPLLSVVAKVSYGSSEGRGKIKLIILRDGEELETKEFSQDGRAPVARLRFKVRVLALQPGDTNLECVVEVHGHRRPHPLAFREPVTARDRGGPATLRVDEPYQFELKPPLPPNVKHGEKVRAVLMATVRTQAVGEIVAGTCLFNGKPPKSLRIPGNSRPGKVDPRPLMAVEEVFRTSCPFGFDGEEMLVFRPSDIRVELWFDGLIEGKRRKVRLPYVYVKYADELGGVAAVSRPHRPRCSAHDFDVAACRCRPAAVAPVLGQPEEIPEPSSWMVPRQAMPPVVFPVPVSPSLPEIDPLPVPPPVETPEPATPIPVFVLPRFVVRGHTAVIEGGPYQCGAVRTVPVFAREAVVVTECAGDRLAVAIPADAPLGLQEVAVQESPQVHFLVGETTIVELEAGRTRTPSSLQTVNLWVQLHGTSDIVAMKITSSDSERCRFPGNRPIHVETTGGEPNMARFECHGVPSTARIRLKIQLGEETTDLPAADPADDGS